MPLIQIVPQNRRVEPLEPREEERQGLLPQIIRREHRMQEVVKPRPQRRVAIRVRLHRNRLAVVEDAEAVERHHPLGRENHRGDLIHPAFVGDGEQSLLHLRKGLVFLGLGREPGALQLKKQLVSRHHHRSPVEQLVERPAIEPILVQQGGHLLLLELLHKLAPEYFTPAHEALSGAVGITDHAVLADLGTVALHAVRNPEQRPTGTDIEVPPPAAGELFLQLGADLFQRDGGVPGTDGGVVGRLEQDHPHLLFGERVPDPGPVGPELEILAWLQAGAVETA